MTYTLSSTRPKITLVKSPIILLIHCNLKESQVKSKQADFRIYNFSKAFSLFTNIGALNRKTVAEKSQLCRK